MDLMRHIDPKLSPVVYGKLPSHGDFIRHAPDDDATYALDDWLQKGISYCQSQLGPGWEKEFDRMPAYDFVFTKRGLKRGLVGTIRPSMDSAGRRYPIIVAFSIDQSVFTPAFLADAPVEFDPLLSRLGLRNDIPLADLDKQTIIDAVETVSAAGLRSISNGSVESLHHRLGATAQDMFWESVISTDDQKYVLLYNLTEILSSTRNGYTPNYGLSFPLPASGGEAAGIASMWMSLCMKMYSPGQRSPALFWEPSRPLTTDVYPLLSISGESTCNLILFLDSPPQQSYQSMVLHGQTSRHLCNLPSDGLNIIDTVKQRLEDPWSRMLRDQSMMMSEFVDQF